MLARLLFCFALPFRLTSITCIDTRLGALDCWFWIDHGAKKDRPAPARKKKKEMVRSRFSIVSPFVHGEPCGMCAPLALVLSSARPVLLGHC